MKVAYPPNQINNDVGPTNNNSKLIKESNEVFSRLFALPQYQNAKSIGFFLSMPSGEIQTREAIRKIVVEDGKVLYVPRVGLDFEECDMDLVRAVNTSSSPDGGKDGGKDGGMFYDAWPKNKWNIPEPPIAGDMVDSLSSSSTAATTSLIAQPGDIDLLIVPGLAFDSNGHRLGQGKGYYDRFISKMRGEGKSSSGGAKRSDDIWGDMKNKPFLVGVCLEEQFLDAVPYEEESDEGEQVGVGGIPITHHDYIMDMVLTPSRMVVVPRTS